MIWFLFALATIVYIYTMVNVKKLYAIEMYLAHGNAPRNLLELEVYERVQKRKSHKNVHDVKSLYTFSTHVIGVMYVTCCVIFWYIEPML